MTESSPDRVRIEYCTSWGYLPRAAGLAENILHDYYDRLPGGVTVVPGKPSSFEVFLGDRRVFSKLATEEFPEENEVEEKIGELLDAS